MKEYLEGASREGSERAPAVAPEAEEGQALAQFEADWTAFAEGLDHLPPLPADAFSREAMYSDHD